MEGMGHGKPIIATRVGGIPEVVTDGVNGLLIPPKDHAALANALERLLHDPALRVVLGQHARETYEQEFTVTSMLEETWKVYESLFCENSIT
jgi:glycosyltransferase involved in cell wall biosynthesis